MPVTFKILDADFTFQQESPHADQVNADLKEIRKKISLDQNYDGTCVIFLAIHQTPELNSFHSIPAYSGEPVNVGVYDMVKDKFHVCCYSYISIGPIPINYRLEMKDAHEWSVNVPIPIVVIEKYLDDHQKQELESWKKRLEGEKYTIETIQVVNVY